MNFNPLDLTGKRILVTGASSGIGKVTALTLSKLGGRIIILGRNQERLQKTFDTLSGNGHAQYIFDLDSTDDIPPLLRKIGEEHGPLSGLFHSAGIVKIMPVRLLKKKYIDNVFDSSVKAALMLTKGFCQKGVVADKNVSLIFISSAAGTCGVQGMSIYSASKAAIEGAVRSLACELAPQGIRVNSIIAGAVETEMHDTLIAKFTADEIQNYKNKHLLGFGEPEDIAYAAAFLLSDASKWMTGSSMVVDGGYCCV
jgi:NAD(P)-dependent dehydrogenase (short-subunit alcohol dehydrogenase family)